MEEMTTDHLWQKAYGKSGLYRSLYDNNVIFCPYMHGRNSDYRRYENDIAGLRQYHIGNGYNSATTATIQRYYEIFMAYRPGKNIYIPRRSLNDNEPSNKGVHVQVIGEPYHGIIDDFYGLLCDVRVVDEEVNITPGVRRSISPNLY